MQPLRLAQLAAALLPLLAEARQPNPLDIRACVGMANDAQRLACYDRATHRDERIAAAMGEDEAPAQDSTGFSADLAAAPVATGSLLDSRWELDADSKLGTWNLRGYRPMYLLPIFATDSPNYTPHSPNPDNTVHERMPLQHTEAKFQVSIKAKVWEGVIGDYGDLWLGYTQSSRWQVYNADWSRPFRETNYEPEALLVFGMDQPLLMGWNLRLFGAGINHQSNGRDDPLSRSWNRIVAMVGIERPGWSILLRPWWRVPEGKRGDDNPGISDYIGRAELQVVRETGRHELALALRHPLNSNGWNRGSARFTWSFPIGGPVRGFLEAFSGYGESLIDYNHRANYLGVGISFMDWY